MAVSPSLSHFSQEKAWRQRRIEDWQKVSDECSSGVVRWCMRPRPLPDVCYSSTPAHASKGLCDQSCPFTYIQFVYLYISLSP